MFYPTFLFELAEQSSATDARRHAARDTLAHFTWKTSSEPDIRLEIRNLVPVVNLSMMMKENMPGRGRQGFVLGISRDGRGTDQSYKHVRCNNYMSCETKSSVSNTDMFEIGERTFLQRIWHKMPVSRETKSAESNADMCEIGESTLPQQIWHKKPEIHIEIHSTACFAHIWSSRVGNVKTKT